MAKIVTLSELNATEAYKNNGRAFPHPHELMDEFHRVISNKFPNVEDPDIVVDKESGAVTEGKEDIKTYGRGLVQYTLRGISTDELLPTIGLIWSYDTSKKLIKVFYGVNVFACTNLMISGADDIYERQFKNIKEKSDRQIEKDWKRECEDVVDDVLDVLDKFVDNAVDKFEDYKELRNTLHSTVITGEEAIELLIGRLYLTNLIRGTFDYSTFNEGCRLVFNSEYLHRNKSLYEQKGNSINLWQLYGAFTQRITDGKVDIDLIPNKTLEVTKILTDDRILSEFGLVEDTEYKETARL